MVKRPLLILLACVALVPTPARAATANWVLATFTAGSTGPAEITLRFTVSGPIQGPVTLGSGYARPSDGWIDVDQQNLGGLFVSTSRDLGATHVTLTPDHTGRAEAEMLVDFVVDPKTSLSLVFFADGMTFDNVQFTDNASRGSFTRTVQTGGGTKALTIADPTGNGAGVSAGTVGAGAITHKAELTRGTIGAFMNLDPCTVCVATWSAPDGSGMYESVSPTFATAFYNDPRFGGSPGSWEWSYKGAQTGLPVLETGAAYALYAPIGDAWRGFVR